MKINLVLLTLCMLVHTSLLAQTNELQRSIPEAEGVPSEAVITLFDSLTALPHTDIHSVIVLRHGKVIGEIYPTPFAPEYRHTMYSCSKTFVGAAVGLAIADNRLRLTDRIVSFFPEQLPDSVSENLSNCTPSTYNDFWYHTRLEYAQRLYKLVIHLSCQTCENPWSAV